LSRAESVCRTTLVIDYEQQSAALSRALSVGGLALSVAGRRHPGLRRAAGLVLATGSLALRFGVFEAGRASARDPKYTVVPQRDRLRARERAGATMTG